MKDVLVGMDRILLLCIFSLTALGVVILYAALYQGDIALWQRQNIFWLLGWAAFVVLCFTPLRLIGLFCWPLYGIALLLLLLVPWQGEIQMGARRWLNLFGIIHFQPSELMKWAMVFLLAHWFASREANTWQNLGVAMVMVVCPALLIALQPDLGTAIVFVLAAVSMLVAAGLPWRWLGFSFAGSLLAVPILWHFLHNYQKRRVLTFLDPQSDPLGAGYHVIQSAIAIGSGGFFGKGYLQGSQARLHFLPEQHTDFIFAVLAEQGGLLASGLLLFVYTLLILRVIHVGLRASSRFGSLLCMAVASIFTIYVVVNIGMVSGLLPVVGVPLPLISYGGSALVTMMAALGLVMRVAIESHGKLAWQRPGSPLA